MKKKFGILVGGAALCLPVVSNQIAFAQADAPTKKAIIVVRSDDGMDSKKIREQVIEQLEKAGVAKDTQEKILKQIDAAIGKADAAMKAGGKAEIRAEVIAKATAKSSNDHDASDDEKDEDRVIILNLDSDDGAQLKLHGLGQSHVKDIADQLRARAKVFRNVKEGEPTFRIGIAFEKIEESDDSPEGGGQSSGDGSDDKSENKLTIESVIEESPAAKAGLKEGDLIIKVDNHEIAAVSELQEIVQKAGKEDKSISFTLSRDGKDFVVEVKPAKTDTSDIELQDLELLPQSGFVFDADSVKDLQGKIARINPGKMAQGFSIGASGDSAEIKEELKQIKKELSELKALIQELKNKKD